MALADMPPSHLVVAWNSDETNPLVHSFVRIEAGAYARAGTSA